MKLNRTPVFWGISAALLLGSTCSDALTLGRVRGAALLGRPLDLSVLVQYGADEDVSSACFEADVHYGDIPIERSRVSVNAQPGSQPNSQVVRVTSSTSLDEALVRLTLRAVCSPKASRQYIVLSDVASELAGTGSVMRDAVPSDPMGRPAGNGASAVPTKPVAAAAVGAAANISGGQAQARPAAVAAKPPEARKPRPATIQAAPSAGGLAGAGNKATNTVNTAALEDLQRRVDELAKWQSGASSADDLLKSEARAKALESDIRGLQLVTAKNQQSIQLVATALENQSASDYTRPLVYGLGALLLACLASLAYVARRMRSGGFAAAPWWSAEPESAHSPAAGPVARATAPGALVATNSLPAALSPASARDTVQASVAAALDAQAGDTGAGTVSMDFTGSGPAPDASQQPTMAERSARPDFAPSAPGHMKSINTREMLDVRQQAEFFMALGQHDEAVRLLETSINNSADSNPLVLLDLLKILHTLSRRSDFDRYREEFNAQFTGRIPPYASFLHEGNGLDAYEDICNQIVVLWPTEYTVDYIEQCLVRLPEDDPDQGMDLEAFRDLLMLYGVLKRLDQGYDSNLAPFSTSRTDQSQSAPLVAALTAPLPITPAASYGAATAPMDIDLDLDLNLDEPGDAFSPDQNSNLIDFDMSDYIAQKKSDSAT